MDTYTALLGTGTAGTIVGVIMLIYKTINHKKLKSNCCGYKGEVSIDIGDTTPTLKVPEKNVESV